MNPSKILLRNRPLALFLVAGLVSGHAQAAVLFSDNFEGHTVGAALEDNAAWTKSTTFSTNVEERSVQDESTSTAFGTPNQFIRIIDDNTSNGLEVKTASNFSDTYDALTTLSFDFYEPTGGGDGNVIFGYTEGRLGSTQNRARFTLDNGVLGGVTGGSNTYDLDTTYRVYMVLNDTLVSKSYFGQTIASETAGLWLQESGESMVYAGAVAAANGRVTDGYGVAVTTFSGDLQTLYFDNVVLEVVPEPRAALLGGLGLLALLRRRR